MQQLNIKFKNMKARVLTEQEVTKYQMTNGENFGLLDTEKQTIFIGSDTVDFCIESLQRMTPQHPRYKFMELVQKSSKI